MAVVDKADPDFEDLERKAVRLPQKWWKRLDAIHRATGGKPYRPAILLIRHSMSLPVSAPLPEGPEFVGLGAAAQDYIHLSAMRWGLVAEEAKRRGQSLNTIIQAHLLRGFAALEAEQSETPKK